MSWQRVLVLFLISSVLGALFSMRARAGSDLGTLSRVLRYPTAYRVVGWLCVVGLGLLTLLSSGAANQEGSAPAWVPGFLGALCFASVATVAEFSVRTVRWNEHAIFSTSPWSRTKELLWEDVARVTYSDANRWFVFSSSSGKSVTIPSMMAGVAEFLQHARATLPERVYEAALGGFGAHGGLEERQIRFYDRDGDVLVSASDLLRVLPRSIEFAWDDPRALSAVIEMGVYNGFASKLVPAAARLVVLERESERSLLLSASVWMKSGDLPAAERQLEACFKKYGRTAPALTCEARLFAERGDRERSRDPSGRASAGSKPGSRSRLVAGARRGAGRKIWLRRRSRGDRA